MAFPILPGRVDLARAFVAEAFDRRSVDLRRSWQRLQVDQSSWFLSSGPGGEQLLVYLEGDDVQTVIAHLGRSRDPFDRWFTHALAEVTGVDLRDPPEGMFPAEALASFGIDAQPGDVSPRFEAT